VVGEINELGGLVKQLAASVASHDEMLSAAASNAAPASAPASKPKAEPRNELPFPGEDTGSVAAVAAPANIAHEGSPSRSQAQILLAVKNAVEENRIDIHLQPMVSLPQRKVRFYEAVTRLRDDKDQILTADDFIGIAEAAGLIGRIDHMVMLRCVQVLRR